VVDLVGLGAETRPVGGEYQALYCSTVPTDFG
jgi:hypothetical protein